MWGKRRKRYGKPVRKTMIDELLEEKRERTSYYDTEEHDWITEQEMGSSIMRETDNLWIPVKRFLTKHKKQNGENGTDCILKKRNCNI